MGAGVRLILLLKAKSSFSLGSIDISLNCFISPILGIPLCQAAPAVDVCQALEEVA